MSDKLHSYSVDVQWTGNTGQGTTNYRSYERAHVIQVAQKPPIPASSDPAFRGDSTRYNPEELLVASVSSCHMLWYLHLCAEAGIVVVAYTDQAVGHMQETAKGGGQFTEITLHPHVVLTDATRIADANALHQKANSLCFIANSLNFPVHHAPVCTVSCEQEDC